jgi:hypothetical protein
VTEISLFMVREHVDPNEIGELGQKCKMTKKFRESHNDLNLKHNALHAKFKMVKVEFKEHVEESSKKGVQLAVPQEAVASLPTRGRITLRGLTWGVINIRERGGRGSCILVGDQLCGWLPHVGFLGIKLGGVFLLKSDRLLDLIERQIGDTCDAQVGNWASA